MKNKLCYIFLLVFILPMLWAKPVNLENAKQVAINWTTEKSTFDNFSISMYSIELSENGIPVYYIFNVQPNGFILISADDIAYPIIGYGWGNKYTQDNHPPQFDSWIKNVKKQIIFGIENNITQGEDIQQKWERLRVNTDDFIIKKQEKAVLPLCNTTWDQNQYYNELCPANASGPGGHVYAGCVATATGQVMKYHNHPATGTGSHTYTDNDGETYGPLTANFGSTTYLWGSMPNSISISNNAIATLLYHIGVSIEMDYNSYGSGAWLEDPNDPNGADVVYALPTYFDYDANLDFEWRDDHTLIAWQNMLKSDLDAARPLVYRGQDGSSGHAFVCDGYNDSDQFHFNWGWSGSYDGYYAIDALNPGSYEFNTYQGAIFGIFPNLSAPGVPTNPDPTNTANGISIDTMISWTNGADTDNVDVYFSSNQTLVTNKDASVRIYSSTAISTLDPSGAGSLDYNTTYYWRVICKNSAKAETDGPVWSFTTESAGGVEATLSYHGPSIAYFWHVPSEWGDTEYGVKYTVTDDCPLLRWEFLVYTIVGSPTGITVHVYDEDVDGKPGTELGSVPVPIANITPSTSVNNVVDLTPLGLTFTTGQSFFITYTVDGGVYGSHEVTWLSDDGTFAPESRTYERESNGDWNAISYYWTNNYEMFAEAIVEYSSAIPPNLVITPASIDFQRTAINGYKMETVTLQNTGGGQVVIDNVAIAGDIQIELYDYNTYPDTLFSGESISLYVVYGPDAVGVNNSTITVSETSSAKTDHYIPINGEGYVHNSWASGTPVFDQPPTGNQGDYGWSMSTSDDAPGYMHAENFWSIPEPITAIEFWGINWYYDGGWIESGVEDPMTFEIKFYTDHATEYQPDVEVASFSIPLSRTTVDTTFSSGPMYRYRAELPTSVTLTDGWVSIRGTSVSSPIDPWFLWSTSPVGDLGNVAYDYVNSDWDFDDVDLAFALYTDIPLPPADVAISIAGTNAIVTWTSEAGRNYRVYSDSEPYGSFSTVAGTVTDGSGSFTDPIGASPMKYYKVTTVTHQVRGQKKVQPCIYKSDIIRAIESSKMLTDKALLK